MCRCRFASANCSRRCNRLLKHHDAELRKITVVRKLFASQSFDANTTNLELLTLFTNLKVFNRGIYKRSLRMTLVFIVQQASSANLALAVRTTC